MYTSTLTHSDKFEYNSEVTILFHDGQISAFENGESLVMGEK